MTKKINQLFLISFLALSLVNCQKTKTKDHSLNNPSPSEGYSGIYLDGMDTNTSPKDDFYKYVNGNWIKNNPLPSDKPVHGRIYELVDRVETQKKEIIDELLKAKQLTAVELKVRDLYLSYMDEDAIAQNSEGNLYFFRESIDQIDSFEQFFDEVKEFSYLGVGLPFAVSVDEDLKNPDYYNLYLSQSGLTLPEKSYYFEDSEKFKTYREQYKKHIDRMFQLADWHIINGSETVFSIEEKIATHSLSKEENRDIEKRYNPISIEELQQVSALIPWRKILTNMGITAEKDSIIVGQPEYIQHLDEIISAFTLEEWKVYLKWKLLTNYASYLNKDLAEENFDFFSRTLSGVEEQAPRWKRALSLVDSLLGEGLGKIYVERYFPKSAKDKMDQLVQNLLTQYKQSISSQAWLSETTKAKALDKLSKFTVKIGHPDHFKDYKKLYISRNYLIQNIVNANRDEYDEMIANLGKKVDKSKWIMTPQTVNAYYNPVANEIVFPAGILQPPVFDPKADSAVNYGAIGVIIGHEIGHGFDDEGSKFDGNGKLENWWTDEDRANFNELTQKLIDQYNSLEAIPGHHVNGALTLGENIGDLSGTQIALKAYLRTDEGKNNKILDGFNNMQRFFIGYAQVWGTVAAEDFTLLKLKSDPHSPAPCRVNGILPNVNEFYVAFSIQEGDQMFLPESDRVEIW